MKAIEHYKVEVRIGSGAGGGDVLQPLSVPRYELMILRAIHNTTDDDGQEMQMVVVKGREIVPLPKDDDGKQIFSPRETLDLMRRKYGSRRNGKLVNRLFKTSKALARVVKILEVPDEVKALAVPKGMKASAVAAKLMASKAPAARKPGRPKKEEVRVAA